MAIGFRGSRRGQLFRTLGLVPQRVHLGQRCVLERTALRRERTLDIGEAALELGIRAAQGGFRIGADVAGQVDQCEQEVAGFFSERFGVAMIEDSTSCESTVLGVQPSR